MVGAHPGIEPELVRPTSRRQQLTWGDLLMGGVPADDRHGPRSCPASVDVNPGPPAIAVGRRRSGQDRSVVKDVFDEPSTWRCAAVQRLGLRDEELMAGVATGVTYPLALEPVVNALDLGRGRRALDVGAGLGGVARWLADRTGAEVIALEPAGAAAAGARHLFPDLVTVRASATSLPFALGRFDAVTLLGVVSLVADLPTLIAEVGRVLRPGGRVGLSDLCLVTGSIERQIGSTNTFRSLALLVDELERSAFSVVELAAGDADAAAGWDAVGRRVDDEIEARHGGSPGFDAWASDRHRLRGAIESGNLHVGSLVAIKAPVPGSSPPPRP